MDLFGSCFVSDSLWACYLADSSCRLEAFILPHHTLNPCCSPNRHLRMRHKVRLLSGLTPTLKCRAKPRCCRAAPRMRGARCDHPQSATAAIVVAALRRLHECLTNLTRAPRVVCSLAQPPNLDHAMTAQRVDAGRLGVDGDLAHE
jgi:hypothetical protein